MKPGSPTVGWGGGSGADQWEWEGPGVSGDQEVVVRLSTNARLAGVCEGLGTNAGSQMSSKVHLPTTNARHNCKVHCQGGPGSTG